MFNLVEIILIIIHLIILILLLYLTHTIIINAKGFRLNGTMKLNDIPYNYINDPSNVSFNVFTYNKLAELGKYNK